MQIEEKEKYVELYEKYAQFLTQTQRQALELYLYEDLAISEIAFEVATSRQAASDAIQKGLRKLREINSKLAS